ncbi:hypothetical protein ACL02T_30030 [Pseudonocardia sp. RS010]|uniref:hypothetical protein n=1 Tax=Pseudonocardia sp. RS010 TaxID=3385979 RepID=UPI0039A350A5
MAGTGWTVEMVDELGEAHTLAEGAGATSDAAWFQALSATEAAVLEHPAPEYRITAAGETATLRPGRTATGDHDADAALASLAGLRAARAEG